MKRYKEKRIWGDFERFTLNEKSTVKIIRVKPGHRLSLQYHSNREEFWYFLDNKAKITIGKKELFALPGDSFLVKKKVIHRVEALSRPVSFMEISFGTFNENDIVRIEDDYGRS